MIGTSSPSHPRLAKALGATTLLLLAGACNRGSRVAPNLAPTIVAAALASSSATPAPGDELLLFFSEDVALTGALLTDADVSLSGGGTLGAVGTAPSLLTPRAVSVPLGAGVTFTTGVTQVAFAAGNDAVRDASGQLGTGGTPVTIGDSDGSAPLLTNVTIAAIDDELNGTGPAGGTLQVPPNGWTLDLAYSDNGAIDAARTQVSATVAVGTSAGTQPAGANLVPFLTTVSATNTNASFRVPASVTFPAAPFALTCTVIDASGLASNAVIFDATARTFSNDLRPFETNVNPQQTWFLDFSRDVESFTTSSISGGVSVDVIAAANGRSDFEDLLRILGLTTDAPIPNVSGGQNSNQVVSAAFKSLMLDELAGLYDGANVEFTINPPGGSFGSNPNVPYDQFGFSQISIAGKATSNGVLGVAVFDPSNRTQNDNTRLDFSGVRLGVFLHTIVDSGMGPPSGSQFRVTFSPFALSLGGTPIGNDAQDGARLTGALNDGRSADIDVALADFARFTAVVTAHECGHSMGLVQNGAMPVGLYGNDIVNFPGSADGHIRNASLFPAGTNVMSPSLSYSLAVNAGTRFNTLNMAYLREQVFYGN